MFFYLQSGKSDSYRVATKTSSNDGGKKKKMNRKEKKAEMNDLKKELEMVRSTFLAFEEKLI